MVLICDCYLNICILEPSDEEGRLTELVNKSKFMHLCRWPLPWLVWLFKAKDTGDSKIPVHGAWFFKLVLRWSHELFHDNNEHNPLSYKLKFRRRAVVPSSIEVYICSEANFALNQLNINKLFSYIFYYPFFGHNLEIDPVMSTVNWLDEVFL